ncbi:glycosyltransferase family 4 protein [Lichenicoccus sp.]|uniref:glycosyltransferase family 4 protein n=1 Tax=Lichenicoccus sp. TaxID=2781899 RepID=UPI003D150513
MLPPREGFSPEAVGAIGLLVHRLSTDAETIIGAPLAGPAFAGRRFVAAEAGRWPLVGPGRYTEAVARVLRRLRPTRIEVHNRPEIARGLSRRFPGVPLTLFLHNDPQAMRRARSPTARASLLTRMRVVCVSETLRARFLEGVRTPHTVAVLPNCIDLDDIPPSPPARERLILFAGRMVADKGADAFVAACAQALPRLEGWRAAMIGADRFAAASPQTPFLAALRPAAEAEGIALLGYLPHARVLEAMAQAAIVVVPSRWQEPFGMTALEAMACGAALIVSKRPGLLEVVGDAALLAEPDPPEMLAETIVGLAGDAALQRRLGALGRARAACFARPIARARLEALRA